MAGTDRRKEDGGEKKEEGEIQTETEKAGAERCGRKRQDDVRDR